jgi:hypothetical protein
VATSEEVLMVLTLRPFADRAQAADILGAEEGELEGPLAAAVAAGEVAALGGTYGVTRRAGERLGDIYKGRYAEVADEQALEDFERVNKSLLAVLTDWQTVEVAGQRVPNDHGDPAYDEEILTRLDQILERVRRALAPIAAADPLTGRFLDRLTAALEKAEAGERSYVSDVEVESFHNIWFQLHEHLLRMHGRERSE